VSGATNGIRSTSPIPETESRESKIERGLQFRGGEEVNGKRGRTPWHGQSLEKDSGFEISKSLTGRGAFFVNIWEGWQR